MVYKNEASFATLLSTTPASIGASYAAIGTPTANPAIAISFVNNTNGDVLVSQDGTNDNVSLAAGASRTYNVTSNSPSPTTAFIPKGTQYFVKDGTTAGTTGTFIIEILQVTI